MKSSLIRVVVVSFSVAAISLLAFTPSQAQSSGGGGGGCCNMGGGSSQPQVTCGPGTKQSGTQCVPSK